MGDSSKNERYAVNAVAELVDSSPRLSAEFASNDRTPCYDGDILIYDREDTNSKEHLSGRLPVQIKFRKLTAKGDAVDYSIPKSDLKIYYQDGGVLYFIVTKEIGPRVYYASLLPYDIRTALNSAAEFQKGIRFSFSEFPRDRDEILTLLVGILHDKRNQAQLPAIDDNSFRDLCAQVQKMRRIQVDFTIPNGIPMSKAIGFKRYCYAGVGVGGLKVAVGVVEKGIECITQSYQTGVVCGGERFYDSTSVRFFKNRTVVVVGNSVTLVLEHGRPGSLNVKSKGRLSERLVDARFLSALRKHRAFSFAPECKLSNFSIPQDAVLERNPLDDLPAVANLLRELGLESDFDLDHFTQEDWDLLNSLWGRLFRGEELSVGRGKGFFELLSLGGETCLVLCGVANGRDVISPIKWFNTVVKLKSGEDEFEASFFLALNADMLRRITRLDFDYVLSEVTKAKRTKKYVDHLHKWLINTLLPVADEGRFPDGSLLSFAERLFVWICEDPCGFEDFAFLNLCQIRHRQKKLSDSEIARLRKTAADEEKSAMVRAGAYILLGDCTGFQTQHARLNEEDRKMFDAFPIMKLLHLGASVPIEEARQSSLSHEGEVTC